MKLLIPFSHSKIANEIRDYGIVESEEYTEQGLEITAVADISYINKIKEFVISLTD